MSEASKLGRLGEDIAVSILQSHQYTIIGTNIRFSFGEIDILAKVGDTLVAVEVKTRSPDSFAHIHRSLHPQKLQRIALGLRLCYPDMPLRIDALCLCIHQRRIHSCRLLKDIYRAE